MVDVLLLIIFLSIKILKLRNHGQGKNYEHEFVGINSRLDSLNAFVLNEKLSIFQEIKKSRNDFYNFYINNLSHLEWMNLPTKENENIILNYFTITVSPLIRNKVIVLFKSTSNWGIYLLQKTHSPSKSCFRQI